MIRTELMIPSLLVSACALLVASCESTTQVGSDCRNGVCPRENLISSEACIASSTSAEIAVTRLREEPPGTILGNVCLPRPLATDSQGQVACRVLWRLGEAFDSDDELPAEVAPGFHFYSRGLHDLEWSRIPEVLEESLWCDRE